MAHSNDTDTKIKPYLVFAGDLYYPTANMGDYKGDFASFDLAMLHVAEENFEWWCIVEHATMEVVRCGP